MPSGPVLQHLHPKRGRLRRNAERLRIGMGDSDHLAGAEVAEADRSSEAVGKHRRVGDVEPGLIVGIVGASQQNIAVVEINPGDSACGHGGLGGRGLGGIGCTGGLGGSGATGGQGRTGGSGCTGGQGCTGGSG